MLKCLCKNKRELKAIVKAFSCRRLKKKNPHKSILELSHYNPIQKPFTNCTAPQPVFRTGSSYFYKKALKNYLSAHSRDTNIQFSAGCLEETPERDKWITTSTGNASLCIIQPLKLSPSLPFPGSVTRGCFRWPARLGIGSAKQGTFLTDCFSIGPKSPFQQGGHQDLSWASVAPQVLLFEGFNTISKYCPHKTPTSFMQLVDLLKIQGKILRFLFLERNK